MVGEFTVIERGTKETGRAYITQPRWFCTDVPNLLGSRVDQPRVFFDGRKIGKVGPGEHLTLLPSPGKHLIAVDDDWLALELKPNGQYYVRVSGTGSWPRT